MHSSRMRTVRNSSRLLGGGCLLPGGVSTLGGCLLPRGGVSVLGGVSAPGGCLLPGGGLLPGGRVGIPACTEADHPCGQTDRCQDITFATSLRTVTRMHFSRMRTVRCSGRLSCSRGVGLVSQHALRQTTPVDRQTGVKT